MAYIVTYPVNREQDSYWIVDKLEELPKRIADEAGFRRHELGRGDSPEGIKITAIYEVAAEIKLRAGEPGQWPPGELTPQMRSIYDEAQRLFIEEEVKEKAKRDERQRGLDRRQLEALKRKLGEK